MIFYFNLLTVTFLCYFFFLYTCVNIKLNKQINNIYHSNRSSIKMVRSPYLNISNSVFFNKNDKNNIITKNDKDKKCNIRISCNDNKANIFRKDIFLLVKEKNNIKNVKEEIEKIYGIPTILQQIFYEEKILDDMITIENLSKDKKIKFLNMRLVPILPHLFDIKETEQNGKSSMLQEVDKTDQVQEENKKITKLKQKLKFYGYLTLINKYKKLLEELEKKNYIINSKDMLESYKSFDVEFDNVLKKYNINFEKIKKEIEDLKFIQKKKLLLRLEMDYPFMSILLIDRIKQLFQFYYMGNIKSSIKFFLFFYILYKYADYPVNVKKSFLYISFFFLLAPCKPFYKFSHFLFFFIPKNLLCSGFTNILSASYQQILMCQ
ncbi:ubiquitin [Hepatocystis sp. ex Piliocolobus tephrosceles]|nr:ubiquitin [Hepatocystis sp. ex Piliocolobus tephrosceles]